MIKKIFKYTKSNKLFLALILSLFLNICLSFLVLFLLKIEKIRTKACFDLISEQRIEYRKIIQQKDMLLREHGLRESLLIEHYLEFIGFNEIPKGDILHYEFRINLHNTSSKKNLFLKAIDTNYKGRYVKRNPLKLTYIVEKDMDGWWNNMHCGVSGFPAKMIKLETGGRLDFIIAIPITISGYGKFRILFDIYEKNVNPAKYEANKFKKTLITDAFYIKKNNTLLKLN